MLSQVVINQGNFALQNRAENVVQTVVHCFSITSSNKLIINKIIPLSQSPLGSQKGHFPVAFSISSPPPPKLSFFVQIAVIIAEICTCGGL